MTTDGAAARWRLVRPGFRLSAVAEEGAEQAVAFESVSKTGAWECLRHN